MKTTILGLLLVLINAQSFAQNPAEQEVIKLSKEKWQWMADKNVDKLKDLFDEKSENSKLLEAEVFIIRKRMSMRYPRK